MRPSLAAILALPLLIGAAPQAMADASGAAASTTPPSIATPFRAPLSKAAHRRLIRYIASYDSDAFLADTLVRPELARILGGERDHLLKNISVRSTVSFNSGIAYLEGNAPHMGGEEHGFVGIEVYSGRVCAAILTEGRIDVYGAGADRDALPTALRDWIFTTWAIVTLNWSMPPNVRLVEETPAR